METNTIILTAAVKEFWKSVNIHPRYGRNHIEVPLLTHTVYNRLKALKSFKV
jgi:hypothetical protein